MCNEKCVIICLTIKKYGYEKARWSFSATNKKFQKASAPILLDLKKYSSLFSLLKNYTKFNNNMYVIQQSWKFAKGFGSLKNIS